MDNRFWETRFFAALARNGGEIAKAAWSAHISMTTVNRRIKGSNAFATRVKQVSACGNPQTAVAFKQTRRETVIRVIGETGSLKLAAQLTGQSRRTLQDTINADPDYKTAVELARLEAPTGWTKRINNFAQVLGAEGSLDRAAKFAGISDWLAKRLVMSIDKYDRMIKQG